jgi:hypothetical protein
MQEGLFYRILKDNLPELACHKAGKSGIKLIISNILLFG